jgi:CheY-like chemotaxis protein
MTASLLCDLLRTEALDSQAFNRRQTQRRIFAQDSQGTLERGPAAPQVLQVLIVDEDRDATDALAKLVDKWGHKVQSAYTNASGLDLATALQPDVVLLGISVSNTDALEMARRLRDDVRLKKCFVIAVSNGADDVCRRECAKAGIDLYLIKPVDAFVLETLLLLEAERLDGADT